MSILRYSQSLKGALEFTGNTQGLSTDPSYALSNFAQASAAPPGGTTTGNYLNASSSAYLVMTAGATVKYAELIWAFNLIDGSAEESNKDDAIQFITPNGSFNISPDAETRLNSGSFEEKNFYTRSANVTQLVKSAGAGLYTVGKIPSQLLLPIVGSGQNYSGWVLQVVYEDLSLPIREINLWVSNILQKSGASVTDISISGFGTPASGTVNGRLAVFVGDGNIGLDGEGVYFGRDTSNLVQLSGPNNPASNFFKSQINDGNSESQTVGQLNQTGTFGNSNQGQAGSPSPWRNTIDITNVSLASGLINNQTSGIVRFSTTQDNFIISGFGLQIDAVSPIFHPDINCNKSIIDVSEVFTYTATFTNNGTIQADNLEFKNTIPSNTSFVTGSVTVNGTSQPSANPSSINVGNVAINQTVTITYDVTIDSIPEDNNLENNYKISYGYIPVAGVNVTDTISSNLLITEVKNADIESVKSTNRQFADIEEIITYTVTLTNKGNTVANNIVFNDSIPSGSSLVANSVTVNGVLQALADPSAGINITSIGPNISKTIVFKIKVGNTIPVVNPIVNASSTNFDYIVDPANPPVSKVSVSNQVSTHIKHADLISAGNLVISSDKQFADLNELVTYTVLVNNTGNTAANNILFVDVIPSGAVYEPGSLLINNIPISGDPNTGINIGTINANSTTTINFKVKVVSIPIQNPIENKGNITYTYTVNPALPNAISENEDTNIVLTQINNAAIISQITSNKQFVDLRDIITYNVSLTNTGNISANNVIVTNPAPTGTSFVLNSVLIDGVTQIGVNPNAGVNVGNLSSGQNKTVSFKMQLGTILPPQNPISNSSTVNFTYLVNTSPSGVPLSGVSTSNVIMTQVNYADLISVGNLVKQVDKQFADVNDVLTYTIKIKNTGNTSSNNVIFKDNLDNSTSYKMGSLKIDGVSRADNPKEGIILGSIEPNQIKNIQFKVIVNDIPTQNPISNRGNLTYNYTVDPAFPNGANNNANTNIVTTRVNHANLISEGNVLKSVDKAFAKVGEVLSYTVSLKNTGNCMAKNVLIKDIIPAKTELIAGSLMIDGILKPTSNPYFGINIGNIDANKQVLVNFKVLIKSLPLTKVLNNQANIEYNYIVNPFDAVGIDVSGSSNIVSTRVTQPDFIGPNQNNFVKSVDKVYVDIGDEVTYTLYVKNTGNIEAENVILTDLIQEGTVFKQGTVTIDGNKKPAANPNLGILLDTININQTLVLSFKVEVVSIPDLGKIENQGILDFNYTLNPSNPQGESGNVNSNKTILKVSHGQINSNDAILIADKINTTPKDSIIYTLNIKNVGNVPLTDAIVNNAVPEGTKFIPGTVKINNTEKPNENPNNGVNIGEVLPYSKAKLSFAVKVNEDSKDMIINKAIVNYSYFADPSKPLVKNIVETNMVNISNLRPELELIKTSNRVGAVVGDIIRYNITGKNIGPVDVNNIVITDLLDSNLEYVGNLIVNGIINSGNITLGINVGNLSLDQRAIVSFDAKVISAPSNKIIKNKASAIYNYFVNDGGSIFNEENLSNENSVNIYTPSIIFDKSYDKSVIKQGDTFIYTILATNKGDIDVNNAVLKDILPKEFKVEEVKVDGLIISGDINTGLSIGSIGVGQTKIVTLVVRVLGLMGGNNIWL